jgi:WD40 repeat protein
MKHSLAPIFLAALFVFFAAIACQAMSPAPTPTPTLTATTGPTLTPSITPTPSQTPSPTPLPANVISHNSCKKLSQDFSFGEGSATGMLYNQNGTILLVWTYKGGTSAYDLIDNKRLWHKPDLQTNSAGLYVRNGIVLVADKDDVLHKIELKTGKILDSFPPNGDFREAIIAPGGKFLAILDWFGGIYLYNAANFEFVREIPPHGETFGETFFTSTVFSPDDRYLLVGTLGGEVLIYQAETGRLANKIPRIWDGEDYFSRLVPSQIVISGNSQTIAVEYLNNGVMLTQLNNPRISAIIPGEDAALSQDGRLMSLQTEQGLEIVETQTKATLATLPLTSHGISSFSPDNSALAIPQPGGLSLFNTTTWDAQATLEAYFSKYSSFALASDGNSLAVLDKDGWFSLVEVSTGKAVKQQLPFAADRVEFGTEGRSLLFSDSQNILVWEVASQKNIREQTLDQPAVLLAIAPDGNKFAILEAGGNFKIRHFDGTSLEIHLPEGEPTALAFSPDSQKLFTALKGGKVLAWDSQDGFKTGSPMPGNEKKINIPTQISFSSDGKRLEVTGLNGSIPGMAAWNLESGEPLRTMTSPDKLWEEENNPKFVVALSPFANVAFTYSMQSSESAQLREAYGNRSCKFDKDTPLENSSTLQAVFSPDGSRLYVLSFDGLVQAFSIKP